MANYTNLANSLSENNSNLKTDYSNINSLLNTLKGTLNRSSTKLNDDAETCLKELKEQMDYIDSLANALKLVNEHNEAVKTLNKYKSYKNNWQPDINNSNATNPYSGDVQDWERKVSNIENQIQTNIPQVNRISSNITLINSNVDFSYKDYTKKAIASLPNISGINTATNSISYQELLSLATSEWIMGFKNNKYGLTTSTLAKCGYTAQEIDNIINARLMGATPRERAVISALTIIQLGLDKGIKSNYELSTHFFNSISKPYDTNALITHGADCASFLSWALNKASTKTFNNASTKTLRDQGIKTSYDNLQPGDIIYNSGHVAMVIANNINGKSGDIIVADASHYDTGGYPKGIRLQRISYASLRSNDFTGYDMDSFYDKSA